MTRRRRCGSVGALFVEGRIGLRILHRVLVRMQAYHMERRPPLPQHPACKLGRDFYDKCFDYESKQQVIAENSSSVPVSSKVFTSERVLIAVSFGPYSMGIWVVGK